MADNTQVDIGALPPPPTGGETRRGRHAGIGLRCAQSRDDPNRVQSAVYTAGFGGDKNVLIFQSTGLGQTTIAACNPPFTLVNATWSHRASGRRRSSLRRRGRLGRSSLECLWKLQDICLRFFDLSDYIWGFKGGISRRVSSL